MVGRPKKEGELADQAIKITKWTKSQLDGLVTGKRKTYDLIIRALIYTHRSAAGVARKNALHSGKAASDVLTSTPYSPPARESGAALHPDPR